MLVGDVVQFNENHKWCSCLGIIAEAKKVQDGYRYMIGVPMPQQGTAFIFDDGTGIELIGIAHFVIKQEVTAEE